MKLFNSLALSCLTAVASMAQPVDPLDQRFFPPIAIDEAFPSNVWVTGSLAKIGPGATPGRVHWAEISSARNEFESFQVHVHAGPKPVQLNATIGNFVNAQTGGVIESDANVTISREDYLNVTTVSDLNGTPGLTPDALIPARDPYFHQARNAFPVAIPPNETRSIWIDVYVPQKAVSGYYSSTVTLSDGAQLLAKVPVRLKVWNFELPSTATLRSAFGLSFAAFCYAAYGTFEACAKYPGSQDATHAVALTHAAIGAFFLDHRVSISAVVVVPTVPRGKWNQFDAVYGPLLNGQAKTILPGAQLSAIEYAKSPTLDVPDLKDWVAHFRAKGWLSRLQVYQCDEPPAGCTWPKLLSGANALRDAAPGVPVLVTTNISLATQNGVLDGIDMLAPVVDHVQPKNAPSQRDSYNEWQSHPGKQLWWYQSCDQYESCQDGTPGPKTSTWPVYTVDGSPVRNRVFQWLAFLYKIQGELYFATDAWGDNPWDHLYLAAGNGSGALFYPGTTSRIGGTTPIPIPSIRLNLIRDGMEDYEYLFALAKAGEAGRAEEIARSFITNAYTFKNDPEALTSAREKLGTRLHELGQSRQH
jgi:hypothetical protein